MQLVQNDFDTAIPAHAKWSFTTRRVNHADVAALEPVGGTAKAGDLILAEIMEVNQHKKIQLLSLIHI